MDLSKLTPGGLIIDGEVVACDAVVYNWHDTGLEVKVGGNNHRRQAHQEIDLFVVHWTGGYGDCERLFATLNKRVLGVEFFIDYDGSIVQYCDPILVNTADAGFVNPRSVGVEVRCAGFPGGKVIEGQDVYSAKLRGHTARMLDFTTEQDEALHALIEALRGCRHPLINIPGTVPRDGRGQLLTTTMSKQEIRNYSGVIGHYHLSANKADPGTRPMLALSDRGYR